MLDPDEKIGYVRVLSFGRHTARSLRQALSELRESGMQGLILDLRFNPGGLLSAAVDVSDLFISEGRIVSTSGRNVKEQSWDAHDEGTFEGFPMVVLVNGFSASASEIVAACLQDHERAVVVGRRTYGKGSVQNIVELEGGRSALKLTTASYRRPNGENIHRSSDAKPSDAWGVKPDEGFEVTLSGAQMRSLAQARRVRDSLKRDRDDEDTDEVEEFADPQVEKGLSYLRERITALKEDHVAAGESNSDASVERQQ
jgi:carboxyl-terminal processing protease